MIKWSLISQLLLILCLLKFKLLVLNKMSACLETSPTNKHNIRIGSYLDACWHGMYFRRQMRPKSGNFQFTNVRCDISRTMCGITILFVLIIYVLPFSCVRIRSCILIPFLGAKNDLTQCPCPHSRSDRIVNDESKCVNREWSRSRLFIAESRTYAKDLAHIQKFWLSAVLPRKGFLSFSYSLVLPRGCGARVI